MDQALENIRQILDDGEEIVETIRPNKKRYVNISTLSTVLFLMVFILIALGMAIGIPLSTGAWDNVMIIPLAIFVAFPLIIMILTIIGYRARYNKTYYIITNKRIIIRSGFVGADFKSLEFSTIGMVNVNVDFLDKFVHPNTGSIQFGSNAAPIMMNSNGQQVQQFVFAHIDNPYEVYKRIKGYIDLAKTPKAE